MQSPNRRQAALGQRQGRAPVAVLLVLLTALLVLCHPAAGAGPSGDEATAAGGHSSFNTSSAAVGEARQAEQGPIQPAGSEESWPGDTVAAGPGAPRSLRQRHHRARSHAASRCVGTTGSWCGGHHGHHAHLAPAPFRAPPVHGKPCPGNCSGVGNCHGDSGTCDCPAGGPNDTTNSHFGARLCMGPVTYIHNAHAQSMLPPPHTRSTRAAAATVQAGAGPRAPTL